MELERPFFNTADFQLQSKKLGKGAYGTNVEESFDGKEQKTFLQESLILHKLNHPSIVQSYGIIFKSLTNPTLLEPSIITGYLPNGSLKNILDDEKRALTEIEWSETKKYIIILGICDAIRYLHEQGIAHRYLKPENILIDSNYYPRFCQICAPLYKAPEILRGEKQHDFSVDVCAYSMIACEILTGKVPHYDLGAFDSPFALATKIMNGDRPKFNEFVTKKMQDLLSRFWSEKQEERPTFEEYFMKFHMTYHILQKSLMKMRLMITWTCF